MIDIKEGYDSKLLSIIGNPNELVPVVKKGGTSGLIKAIKSKLSKAGMGGIKIVLEPGLSGVDQIAMLASGGKGFDQIDTIGGNVAEYEGPIGGSWGTIYLCKDYFDTEDKIKDIPDYIIRYVITVIYHEIVHAYQDFISRSMSQYKKSPIAFSNFNIKDTFETYFFEGHELSAWALSSALEIYLHKGVSIQDLITWESEAQKIAKRLKQGFSFNEKPDGAEYIRQALVDGKRDYQEHPLILRHMKHLKLGILAIPKYFRFSRADYSEVNTKAVMVEYTTALFIEGELSTIDNIDKTINTQVLLTHDYLRGKHPHLKPQPVASTHYTDYLGDIYEHKNIINYANNARKCIKLIKKYYRKFKSLGV